MIGVPGMDISKPFISSIRRRSLSISGASRRRIPTIDAHGLVVRILVVHVVAFDVRHHLQRQLVVIAQENAPLAALGNFRRLLQNFDDRLAVFQFHRHEHSGHQRKMKCHVEFVARSPK